MGAWVKDGARPEKKDQQHHRCRQNEIHRPGQILSHQGKKQMASALRHPQKTDGENAAVNNKCYLGAAQNLAGALVKRSHLSDQLRILLIIVLNILLPHAGKGKIDQRILIIKK